MLCLMLSCNENSTLDSWHGKKMRITATPNNDRARRRRRRRRRRRPRLRRRRRRHRGKDVIVRIRR